MKSQTSLGKALRLLFAIGETTNPAGIGVAELMKGSEGLSADRLSLFK